MRLDTDSPVIDCCTRIPPASRFGIAHRAAARPTPFPLRPPGHVRATEGRADVARRIPVWETLGLRESRLSQNTIAAALHMSKVGASDTLAAASGKGVSREDAEGMGDSGACGALFLERARGGACTDPDLARAHGELAKSGVTPRLPRAGHADGRASRGEPLMLCDCLYKRYRELAVCPGDVCRVRHGVGRTAGAGCFASMRIEPSPSHHRELSYDRHRK